MIITPYIAYLIAVMATAVVCSLRRYGLLLASRNAARLAPTTSPVYQGTVEFSIARWTSCHCKPHHLARFSWLIVRCRSNAITIFSAIVLMSTIVFEGEYVVKQVWMRV